MENISWAVRGGATHSEAARRSGAGQDGTPTRRFAQEAGPPVPQDLQGIEDNCRERLFERTKKRNPI